MSQKPTITKPEQMEALVSKAHGIRRRVILPNETEKQAKKRWIRETEIERWRDNDKRLVGNQIMAVHYDD